MIVILAFGGCGCGCIYCKKEQHCNTCSGAKKEKKL